MNVLYEGAIYQILRCGGVARCFSELIHHLPAEIQPHVVGPIESPPPFGHPQLDYHGVATEPSASWLRKITRERFQRRIKAEFEAIPADVEHWTYYGGLCRRPIERGRRPLVVTVLDFIHEAFPSLDRSGTHVAMKYEAIRIADRLVCISQSTYNELCDRFPQAREKASVIPLGTSLCDVAPAALPESLDGKRYVLFVGRRNSYKNFSVVWEAWKRLQERRTGRDDGCKLVVVGPPMKRREAAELKWSSADESVVLIPHASDSVLRTLYEHAQAFVFPSKAEGFGLPSLEAMAAGTPVLVSDLPVMREVVADCGYYFDPDDADSLSAMFAAALDGSLSGRERIVRAARARAERFTWTANARATADVYAQLVADRLPDSEMLQPLCLA